MNKKKLYNKRSRGTKLNANGKRKISKVRKILSGGKIIDFNDLEEYSLLNRDKLDKALREQLLEDPSQSELAQRLIEQYGELIGDIWQAEELCEICETSFENLETRFQELFKKKQGIAIKPTPEQLEAIEQMRLWNITLRERQVKEGIPSGQGRLTFAGKDLQQPGQTDANTLTLLLPHETLPSDD